MLLSLISNNPLHRPKWIRISKRRRFLFHKNLINMTTTKAFNICHRQSTCRNMVFNMIRNGKYVVNLICFVLIIFGGAVHGRKLLSKDRPKPDSVAPFARWLVSESSWGVMSNIAYDLGGAPFGNVVSYSDGKPNEGSGIPYFYLTTLDPTARYALKDHRTSFTISEYPLGTCGKFDPENPTCAKITFTGKLNELDAKSDEALTAKNALFDKHAEMQNWPKDHNFQVFKLDIEEIFMINAYGGPKPLTVDQYLHSGMNAVTANV